MKRIAVVGTLATLLLAGTVAMAAPQARGDDHRNDRDQPRAERNERDHDYRRDRDGRNGKYIVRNHQKAHKAYGYHGKYHRPKGYAAHRWARGERLPVAYYQRPYVVHDYRGYGLRAPPRGHQWVRVDGDAILAAVATGLVLDAVFNVF